MKTNHWVIKGGKVLGPAPFLLMGIVNLSPESFSDAARGVAHHSVSADARAKNNAKAPADKLTALKCTARNMFSDGAAVLDLGGESTRPGAAPICAAEECRRVLPVLKTLQEEFASELGPAFSVDTYKAESARAALAAGAAIINDISAWSFDPELKEALLEHRPGYVLMHCQGRPANMQSAPHYQNVVDEVYAFLEQKLDELVRGGFSEEQVLIDPGIGFGKNFKHNLNLLEHIERFQTLGRPVLVGISYKSFLGQISAAPLEERGPLSATASALLATRGVWAHRVHDVRETRQALELAQALDVS